MKRIKYICLVLLMLCLCSCTTQRDVQIINNPIKVPASLLTPLSHPIVSDYPYTVNTLLIIISQYETMVDKANDRFGEIIFIQSEENK